MSKKFSEPPPPPNTHERCDLYSKLSDPQIDKVYSVFDRIFGRNFKGYK